MLQSALLTLALLIAAAATVVAGTPVTCSALSQQTGYSLSPSSCATGLQAKNTQCTYTCSSNGMTGSSVYKCAATGQWSGTLPNCQRASCSVISNVAHGNPGACGGTKFAGDVCSPTCDNGYSPSNDAGFTCVGQSGGIAGWDATPACVKSTCPPLAGPAHGSVSTCISLTGAVAVPDSGSGPSAKYAIGTICFVNCSAGYSSNGSPSLCSIVGPGRANWAGGQKCVPNTCATLPCDETLGTGSYTSSCQFTRTASAGFCTLSCDTWGYAGSVVRTCTTGTWSQPAVPVCVPLNCTTTPQLDNILAGTCNPTLLNAQCTPTCASLYVYVGNAYTCTGEGSDDVTLVPPSNGPSPQCVLQNCPAIPQSPPYTGGCPETISGHSCLLTCSPGQIPVGGIPIVLDCVLGSWEYPSCIDCVVDVCDVGALRASLGLLAYNVSCRTETVDGDVNIADTCNVSCASGYGGSHSAVAICGSNGIFTGPGTVLSCTAIACPAMNTTNGSSCPTSLGSVCSSSCQAGYSVTGSAPTCGHGVDPTSAVGVWSGPVQTCTAVSCTSFSGTSASCSTSLGSTCHASCPNGYAATGTAPTCTGTGVGTSDWSGPAQSCSAVDCSAFGGYSAGCNVTLGSSCYASCPDDDVATGSAPVCVGQAPGVSGWSGPAQTCSLSSCQSFDDAASVGCSNLPESFCSADCDTGYCVTGTAPQCVVSSPHVLAWTGPEQTCVPATCETFNSSGSTGCSTQLGSTCHASCNNGYAVNGTAPQCQADGLCSAAWSGAAQTCIPVACEAFDGDISGGCNTDLGATCLGTCPNGYARTGTAPVCVGTGPGQSAWFGPSQTCTAVNCTSLGGFSANCSTALGSTCQATCPDNDAVSGEAPTCVGTGVGTSGWTGPAQTCPQSSCSAFTDGTSSGCSNILGSSCVADCGDGYCNVGTAPTCIVLSPHVLGWSGDAQTCSPANCPTLLDSASSECGAHLEDTCYASCPDGYAAAGDAPVCTANGTCSAAWSGPAQTCEPVSCDAGVFGESGCSCSGALNSVCQATCPGGYAATGTAPQCLASGPGTSSWSGPGQTCIPVPCQAFTDSASANCSISLGSSCEASCPSGYEANGTVPECMVTGPAASAWSAPAQTCLPVPCSSLSTTGSTGCSTALGTTCHASCGNGYSATGTAPTCTGTGVGTSAWSGPAQTCVAVNCVNLGGYSSACNTTLGSNCSAACPDEDAVLGSAPTCVGQAPGVSGWSGPAQTCNQSSCPSFGNYASAGCTNLPDSICDASCNSGYCATGSVPECIVISPHVLEWTTAEQTCSPTACGPLAESGPSADCSFFLGATCEISCADGYAVTGEVPECVGVSVCFSAWSAAAQTCEQVPCEQFGGTSSDCSTDLGSMCFASCADGYWASGTPPVCTATGPGTSAWSADAQTCLPASCPSSGQYSGCSSTDLGSTCYTNCSDGYLINGTAPRCQASGPGASAWSGPVQTCGPVSCPAFNEVSSTSCNTTLGSTCAGSCPNGYQISGSIPQCLGTGPGASAWSAAARSCTPVSCSPFVNSTSSGCGVSLGTVCFASCTDGHYASGAAPTCVGSGPGSSAWSGPAQTCKPAPCDPFSDQYSSSCNNNLGATCHASCPSGYNTVGTAPQCDASGPAASDWSGPAQTCQPVSCPAFTDGTSDGCSTSLGSTCDASCPDGYSATGTAPQCLGTGPGTSAWSGSAQTCTAVSCPSFGEGTSSDCSTSLGSTCDASCPSGYAAPEESAPTCEGTGVGTSAWSGPAQTCEPVDCVQLGGYSSNCSTALGSTCNASCPNTDTVSGSAPTCNGDGPGDSVWSGPAQTCTGSACPAFNNSRSAGCSNLPASTCVATCDPGYCQSGTAPQCIVVSPHVLAWNGAEQTCVAVACEAFGGTSSDCSTALGSTCDASCANGYQATGTAPECIGTDVCTSAWSGSAQTCDPVSCTGFLDSPSSGCDTSLGSVCNASCPDGYQVTGTAPQCVGTAPGTSAWSGPEQTCMPVNCSALTGYSANCSTALGAVCDANCPDGYSGSGSAPQCAGTGPGTSSWDGPAQICTAVPCSSFTGASSDCSAVLDSVCYASCADGYAATGTAPQCVATGPGTSDWTGAAQTCDPVSCPAFTDGTSDSCDTSLGSVCQASCADGYTNTGTAPTCLASGPAASAWSGPAQTCSPVSCSAFTDGFSDSCSTDLGSTCDADCGNGYSVSGTAPTCVATGPGTSAWSGSAQACNPVSCTAFSDGTSDGCDTSLGSVCFASCPSNSVAAGDAPECIGTGAGTSAWTGPAQTCNVVCTAVTSAPSNGGVGSCDQVLTPGQTCSISCNSGYMIAGDTQLSCGQEGGALEGSQSCGLAGTCWNSLPGYPVSMANILVSPGVKNALLPGSTQNVTCTQLATNAGVTGAQARMYTVSSSASVFNYTLFCDVVYPASQCLQTCCPPNATSPLVQQYPYLGTVNPGGMFTEKLLALATNTVPTTVNGFCCAGEWRPRYSPVNVDGSYAYVPCINNLPQANDPAYATACPG